MRAAFIVIGLVVAGVVAWLVLSPGESGQRAGEGARTLTITSFGGAYATSQREAYYKPFTRETGVAIVEDEYNGELSKVKAMVRAGSVTWDVVDMEADSVLRGCDEGLLEPIDKALLGDVADFLDTAVHDCGVASAVWSMVIAYDEKKLPSGPAGVADFFDLTKFPGKRTLRKNPKATLEQALMADGVPPDQVYAVLGAPGGVERGLAKLDSIKSQVVWWEAGAQPPQLLADGEVVMAQSYNGRIYDAARNEGKSFKIVWDGQVYDYDYWVVPKGTKRKADAMRFIGFAVQPKQMAEQSKHIAYAPTRRSAAALVSPTIQADMPTAPANFKRAVRIDARWWADHFDEINGKFQAWLAR